VVFGLFSPENLELGGFMLVDRDTLLTVCSKLLPVVRFGFDGVVLFSDRDIIGYNQSFLVAYPLETGITGSVPIKELTAILKKMKPGELELKIEDNKLVVLSNDLWLALQIDPDDYRFDAINELLDMAELHKEWYEFESYLSFKNALELCRKNASKQGYTAFNYVCLAKNEIVGADDFRISRYELPEYFEPSVLLHPAQCKAIIEYDLNQFACTDSHIMFLNSDDILLIAHNYQASFERRDISPLFEFEGEDYILPKELNEHINSVRVMATGKSLLEQTIMITLNTGYIVVRAEKDIGIAEVECDAPELVVKKELSFLINPLFFSEALKNTNCVAKIGKRQILLTHGSYSNLISLHTI